AWSVPTRSYADINLSYVTDEADLLSSSEESALTTKLESIKTKHGFDVFIVTVNSLEGMTSTQFADAILDQSGYGADGKDKSAILLLLSMGEREWAISTNGHAIDAFTDAGQEYLMDRVLPYLGDGDYAGGFNEFADQCDDFITQYEKGDEYDTGNIPENNPLDEVPAGARGLGGLIFGALTSLIVVSRQKGQLKSVRSRTTASDYTSASDLSLYDHRDLYLYRTMSRVRIRRDDNGHHGGGSSVHTSSGGGFHGGSHGKF
ncbi:MAG: TPM domain-containing protein, partial [Eubacterium sp.]|nr:TPM domain-containing protein [Eubacterium sp.]